jgi:Sulfotransferase domain
MREYVTIVSGMPRSGTSLAMQMLCAGGMPLLTDDRRPADAHNPRGYFEYEPVKRLAVDSSWLNAARGRAVKIIYRLLLHLPGELNYKIVFLERDLAEVFESQQEMLRSKNDPAALQNRDRVLSALAAELAKAKEWLADQANMLVLTVPYAEVVRNPLEWSREISRFLDGLDESAMAAAVNPALYRHIHL